MLEATIRRTGRTSCDPLGALIEAATLYVIGAFALLNTPSRQLRTQT